MVAFAAFLAVFALGSLLVAGLYAAHLWLTVERDPLVALPYVGGGLVSEHAVGRYHLRWYLVALMLLAFDMEMVFMYPWTLIVRSHGGGSIVEMFTFMGLLLAGVGYAAREGAFRWT